MDSNRAILFLDALDRLFFVGNQLGLALLELLGTDAIGLSHGAEEVEAANKRLLARFAIYEP